MHQAGHGLFPKGRIPVDPVLPSFLPQGTKNFLPKRLAGEKMDMDHNPLTLAILSN